MPLPEAKNLLLDCERGVLHVTFNRPEARNAMSPELLEDIVRVFQAIASDLSIRAVVLRGAGGHFCAGADLKGVMAASQEAAPSEGQDPLVAMNRSFGVMLREVAHAPQVVIAVCEGAVLGGGFGLTCVSDIAFAHEDARFGMPETKRGLPPAQIAPFVVERIGLTQARRLCLTGAQFRGAEALRLGLVHELFTSEDGLREQLQAILGQVCACAPSANAMTKAILLNVGQQDLEQVLDDAAQKFAQCARSAEAAEGVTAFLEKRPPRWSPQL